MKKFYTTILLISVACLIFGYIVGRIYKTVEVNKSEEIKSRQNLFVNNDLTASTTQKEITNPTYYAPRIDSAKVLKDNMSGYNLQINTSYFYFTPEKLGQTVTQNSGYAYVYINEQKVGRAYSSWMHLPEGLFKKGTNIISITLNSNQYHTWWSKQGTVEAKYSFEVVK